MLNVMTTALRSVNKTRGPLNIMIQPTHEGYTDMLAQTGHNFYMLSGNGIKQWDHHTRPLPSNCFLFEKPEFLPNDVNIDLLLSQERFGNLQRFIEFRNRTGIPVVHIDHALPHPTWTKRQIKESQALRADRHVFITNASKQAWAGQPEDVVIRYGINLNVFKGWTGSGKHGLSIVNHFAQRDVFCGWELWKRMGQRVPLKLVGENKDISESIKDVRLLAKVIGEARFFLNTSTYSTLPLTIPEAMGVGCPIVSTANQEIPNIITHGVDGFISNNENELIGYCNLLLNDYNLAKKMSDAARQSCDRIFNMQAFIDNWNEVFYSAVGI